IHLTGGDFGCGPFASTCSAYRMRVSASARVSQKQVADHDVNHAVLPSTVPRQAYRVMRSLVIRWLVTVRDTVMPFGWLGGWSGRTRQPHNHAGCEAPAPSEALYLCG